MSDDMRSRGLPDLRFLKAQAKRMLRDGDYGKLSEAQRALAAQYGFADWHALKTYVEHGLIDYEGMSRDYLFKEAGTRFHC